MPAHPGRSASAKPGTSSGGWSRRTPPARRLRDENRAPDTLVDATSCAIADAGSIPAVSTNFTDCAEARIRLICRDHRPRAVRRAAHQIAAICGREIDFGEQIGSRLLPMRPRCSLAVPRDQARDQAHRAARRHGAAPLRPSAATAHRAHLSKTWARSADLLHAIQADARADFAFFAGDLCPSRAQIGGRNFAHFPTISASTGPKTTVFGPILLGLELLRDEERSVC